MYHRIAEEEFDPWGLAVTPRRFAQQMKWLARRRTPLRLAEFAHLHCRGRLPANAVAVTFDDAYVCTAEVAAPLLERRGIPATIFIPAELIERGHEFWWDELERIVLHSRRPSLELDDGAVDLGPRSDGDRQWKPNEPPKTTRQQAFYRLWECLRLKAPEELNSAMNRLRQQDDSGQSIRPSHRPMSKQEAQSIRSSILEFGSHALTHPSLPSLSTSDKLHEIRDSVERCAAVTGARPMTFAYPYGDFDAESEQLAEEAGFSCACTADHGFVEGSSRLFALPRIQVGNWSPARLSRALAG